MGRALAPTPRARTAIRRRAARCDARGQSGLHPPQPPRRGGDPACHEPRRLRAVRGIADGAVKTVRGSAEIRRLCRAAKAGATRAADVLRDVRSCAGNWKNLNCLAQLFPRQCQPPGRREAPPDDRLREAIHLAAQKEEWIASSQVLLAMTL